MTALKHKERWSLSSSTGLDVFYGSQIETYLRQHAADLEPGRHVPYGEIPASCFFLSVNFYQHSYELCSADGSPLEFRISTTHVFKKDSPERYAEAKAKLLKNHRHPWFKLLNGICRMPETDRELFRDFSVKDVNRMACWVWERVAGQDKSFRAYAFSVIMTLLEGRLAIESLVARARNGMLPERLKPASFVFNELKPNIKQLLAESSLIKTTPVMRSRFKNPTGVTHCFPLFKQAVGTLACVAPHDPEVLKHRPAYFVLQTSNGWKLYFSDPIKPTKNSAFTMTLTKITCTL